MTLITNETAKASKSCSVYSLGPTEPVTELIKPEEAWVVRCKYGSEVLVTRGDLALPMIDIDTSSALTPLFFDQYLEQTELNLQLRVYMTAHGFRLLVENRILKPDGPAFALLAKAFSCDPSYLALCQKQQCYRARLSLKPDAEEDARVCSYLRTIGDGGSDESLAPLIRLHDERTGALLDSGELG